MTTEALPDGLNGDGRKRNRLNKVLRWVGGCGLLFWMGVYGFQLLKSSHDEAKAVACASNVRQMAFRCLEYAVDHDDRLPPVERWSKSLGLKPPEVRGFNDWRCVDAPDSGSGYAMASKLSARAVSSLPNPAREPLFFDSSLPGWNAHGDLSSLPKPGRHGSGSLFGGAGRYNWIAYADGKVARTPKRRKR